MISARKIKRISASLCCMLYFSFKNTVKLTYVHVQFYNFPEVKPPDPTTEEEAMISPPKAKSWLLSCIIAWSIRNPMQQGGSAFCSAYPHRLSVTVNNLRFAQKKPKRFRTKFVSAQARTGDLSRVRRT